MHALRFTLLLTCMTLINTALASRDNDNDEAYQLLKEGKIMPLEQLLSQHKDRLQGRILDLEMEREQGRVIYEIETMDQAGVVREVKIDAQSGEWLGEKIRRRKQD